MGRVKLSCAAIIALNAFALLEAFKITPALSLQKVARTRVVAMAAADSPSSKSLLVVGSGTLGSMVAKQWKDKHSGARVVAETATASRHDVLRKAGIEPTTRAQRQDALGDASFPYVVFSVPPSKEADYAGELQHALKLWTGEGAFVFTSSGGVFAEDNGGTVDEQSPVSPNPRTKKILDAEKATLEGKGVVLRLAGLYTPDRGPHTFWLARGEVGAPEEGVINMLHYEDAARATIACLENIKPGASQRILLAADDTPLTRRQICEGAIASPLYRGQYKMPVFKLDPAAPKSLGKVYDSSLSRRLMGDWTPRYPSFAAYMAQQTAEAVSK